MQLKQVIALIYGTNGSGKSIGGLSVLKNPKYKVRVLAADANAILGIQDALNIHGVEPVAGQLIVCQPHLSSDKARAFVKSTLLPKARQAVTKEESAYAAYEAIVNSLDNFKGIDWATGEEVDCGSYVTWGRDTVLVVDSLTAVNDVVSAWKQAEIDSKPTKSGQFDGFAFIQSVQHLINNFALAVTNPAFVKCHVIMFGHEKFVSVDESANDRLSIAIIGNKGAAPFMGKFGTVLYADVVTTPKGKNYYWNALKARADTVARGIPTNAGLDLEKLAPDFTHEKYEFFK